MKLASSSIVALAAIGFALPAQSQPIDLNRAFEALSAVAQGRVAEVRREDQHQRRSYGERVDFRETRDVFDGNRIRIIDGDTFALPCDVPGPNCSEKIRIRSIDAPESIEPKCERELEAGLAAKARLASLIRGRQVRVVRTGTDPYGRTLADIHVPEGEVGEVMIGERYVLPYRPGREEKARRIAHWCGRGNW